MMTSTHEIVAQEVAEMKWLRWFIAGALAVPLGHHLMLGLLNVAGLTTFRPYSFEPTSPFGVPQMFSLMFWGGVWGLVLGLALLRVRTPRAYWTIAILFGAIAPTLGAGVIAIAKGQPLHPTPILLTVGLLVNGAWGLATAAFYRWLERWRATSASSHA
jgi:hypothetical protein